MKMTIGRKLGLGFGSVLLLFVILGFIITLSLENINQKFDYVVTHDAPVIANAMELSKLVVDMETGQRGFCITQKEEFLEPYHNGYKRFNELIKQEKYLVSDNRDQVRALEKIENLLTQWHNKAAQPEIAMARDIALSTVNSEYLQELLGKGVGKDILDNMREIMNEMEDAFRKDGNIKGVHLIEMVGKAMVDQETGERGFLITGKDSFLAPFYQGKKDLEQGIKELRSLIAEAHDRVATTKDLGQLEDLTEKWNKEAGAAEIELRRQLNSDLKTYEEIEKVLQESNGKNILDSMREIMARMEADFAKTKNEKAQILLVKIGKSIVDQETGQRGYILTGKESFLEPYTIGQKQFKENIAALHKLNSNAYDIPAMSRNVDRLEKLAAEWVEKAASPEIASRREMNKHPETIKDVAGMIIGGAGKGILDQIREEFDKFLKVENDLSAKRYEDASRSADFCIIMTVSLVVLSIALAGGGGYLISRKITSAISKLLSASVAIADGDLSYEIERSSDDEIGDLSQSFKQMTASLKMTLNENERQNWLKTGQTQINEQVRGDLDTITIAQKILSFLGEYMEVKVGAIYMNQDDEVLKLLGSYAYKKRKNLSNKFKLGEGLIGQAALEKKTFSIAKCP